MKIVYIHLLNDFSGSPRVLRDVINSAPSGFNDALLCTGGGHGFLSNCAIPAQRFWYKRSRFKILTLFSFFASQVCLFSKLWAHKGITKDTIIYVNTLLPFGAALFGWIRGLTVVYHIHEVSIRPRPLRQFLMFVVRRSSVLNIYVSQAHMAALPISGVPATCVLNGLAPDFVKVASSSTYSNRRTGKFRVLMLASLKGYKGILELVQLARATIDNPEIEYDLVANEENSVVEKWATASDIPPNLTVHGRTADTISYYRRADVVLNLSRVDQWVETFGLTVLEAMAFGIPVIVPPVGGPAELVEDGIQGFLVDSRDSVALLHKLNQLYGSAELCVQMSRNGLSRAAIFSSENFAAGIAKALKTASVTRRR